MESRSGVDLPQEIDDYIRETINYTVGLPVSTKTLELKLQASEEARRNLQDQYFAIHSRLKEKDEAIERARFEASRNAQTVKKFVEENQRLAERCSNLYEECGRWEKEGSLYEHDRDALMEFANEADERAKDAEVRIAEADDQLSKLTEELQSYKNECEMHRVNETRLHEELQFLKEKINLLEKKSNNHLDCTQCASPEAEDQSGYPRAPASTPEPLSPVGATMEEDDLLDSVMAGMVNKDGVVENAHAFLEANIGVESCEILLRIWDCLRPSTQKAIALAAEVNTLQNDKEHLRINLSRAEEEVKVLFEENNVLDEEKKRLLKMYNRDKRSSSSASSKGNKRKSSPRICSPIEGMMDLDSPNSTRLPLSPLQHNSPDSRMYKK